MNFKIIYGSSLEECIDVDKKIKSDLPGASLFVTEYQMLHDQLTTVPCDAVIVTNKSFVDQNLINDLTSVRKSGMDVGFYSFVDGSLNKISI